MIEINKKNFAETESQMINSLFVNKKTCIGYAKRYKRTIILYNIQKEKIGIINKYGCLCHAEKQIKTGKYWYSYMDIKEIGRQSISDFKKDLDKIKIKSLNTHEKEYWFK